MVLLAATGLFYSWNKSDLLAYRGVLVGYASVSTVAFAVYASSFFFRPVWRANLALVTVSTVLSLYVIEGFQWFTNYNIDQGHYGAALAAGEDFDEREKIEVIEDLRAKGVDAWPPVTPYMYLGSGGLSGTQGLIYPLGGLSHRVTVVCNETGRYMVYESDEHGFNNPEGSHQAKDIDVAIVGDSFAQGFCVAPGDDMAGVIRSGRFRVLNVGMGGSSLLLELAILREFVLPVKPRVVLWVYYEGNDLADLEAELADPYLSQYLDASFCQGLLARQQEADGLLTEFTNQLWQDEPRRTGNATPVLNFLKLKRVRTLLGYRSTAAPEPSQDFMQIMSLARDGVTRAGGTLYLVYLPTWARYALNEDEDYLARNKTLDIVRGLDIPVIDLHESMSSHPDPLSLYPFRANGHFNAEGYAMLANQIVERLKHDGIGPR